MLSSSLMGKAESKGLVSFLPIQIRDFASDRHRTVDDTPCGGGEGMVMKVDVLYKAWEHAHVLCAQRAASGEGSPLRPVTIYLSPQGPRFDQPMARELAQGGAPILLVCGHYEGVDERFIELCVDREVSIGDYVLTGGELPALVMADAITRVLPGVVGNARSITEDSLENGLLKYPQYTRPREFQGKVVPEVLFSGDHKAIATWRRAEVVERTARKRPDLK